MSCGRSENCPIHFTFVIGYWLHLLLVIGYWLLVIRHLSFVKLRSRHLDESEDILGSYLK